MANESKNLIFWCLVAVVVGLIVFVWGHLRSESAGSYEGSGFMMWAGGICAAAGLIGWQVYGNRKKTDK